MSRRRFQAAELAKLLGLASAPLYVLDDSLTLVYLNEACRAWLGPAADDLLGQQCAYHSGEEPSAAAGMAAGLCPPPAVLEGREITACVAYIAGQQTLFRRARFVPLGAPGEQVLCIVALVESHDCGGYEQGAGSLEHGANPPAPCRVPSGWLPVESDDARDLHWQLQHLRQQARLRYRAWGLVGVVPATRRAAAQAEVAAQTRANVLLLGARGSGRRHLAEVIHLGALARRGTQRGTQYPGSGSGSGPLVPLECSLLDAELIQSTVQSAIAAGEPGTLLLCDADQIPIEAQAVLAAALAAPGFAWRTIATAAAPLVDLAPHGRFREDLAALLSTISIELPPLAGRRDDVPLLAQSLLEEQNARGGKQLGGFAPEALDRLCAYRWPGNVAELAEVVSESHARAAAALVARDDLPERLRVAADAAARPRRKEEPIQIDEFIARIERELIRRALTRSKGNKAKAARLLGLNRPRLYRRMVQLGLLEEGEAE